MTNLILALIGLAVALFFGFAIGYLARKQWAQNRKDSVEAKIEKIIIEAKAKQKEMMLAARERHGDFRRRRRPDDGHGGQPDV